METKMLSKSFAVSIAAALATFPNAALAVDGGFVSMENNDVSANSAATYWTPERLQNAKPLSIPLPKKGGTVAPATTPTGTPVTGNGQAPTVKLTPNIQKLFTPAEAVNKQQVELNNVGTTGAHFTSSRLNPLSADLSYPYVTTGRLFFTTPGGNSWCSASVLRPRVVLTAGHCVHSGTSSGFYSNFLFVPAYRDGVAPYQRWNWSYVITTGTWASGGGGVPNAADYAMLEVADVSFNGVLRKIGNVTGYLGYRTLGLVPNHSTILGYPGNLDSGEKMHQVTAGSFRTRSPNAGEYGSDMRGGSSGGPWIQNFGTPAVGQTGGLNPGSNLVIGVTSYGPIATDPLYQGSSILDSRFTEILNNVCTRRTGNC